MRPEIFRRVVIKYFTLACAILTLACGSDKTVTPPTDSRDLTVFGEGPVSDRFTGELWVRGNVAYTTTWGNRGALGNAVKIWDVSAL